MSNRKKNKNIGPYTDWFPMGAGEKNFKILYTFALLEPAKPLNDAQMCGAFYVNGYLLAY